MKAIISSTYDSKYLFYLPITTWLWNKLGVDVICFMPHMTTTQETLKFELVAGTVRGNGLNLHIPFFDAPKHKEATYAQCSRLYGACLDLPEDEVLITSDTDMGLFKLPYENDGNFTVVGYDLVPDGQMAMCYLVGTVNQWRKVMNLGNSTYQECLDAELGHIEAQHFRGNFWSRDQEIAWQKIKTNDVIVPVNYVSRARPGTQFADNRYDRDDKFILDRLSLGTLDYHMNRPGYTDENFNIIMKILSFHYPSEDFGWLIKYRNKYIEML